MRLQKVVFRLGLDDQFRLFHATMMPQEAARTHADKEVTLLSFALRCRIGSAAEAGDLLIARAASEAAARRMERQLHYRAAFP
jgi:hypothetical protein